MNERAAKLSEVESAEEFVERLGADYTATTERVRMVVARDAAIEARARAEQAEELEVLREYSKGLEAEREGLLKHAEHLRAQLAERYTREEVLVFAHRRLVAHFERDAGALLDAFDAERKR